jgi:hypothetical protein
MSSTNNYSSWTVTTTLFDDKRYWGVRFDWVGIGYILSVAMSCAPAMRIIVLGCSVWLGKIPQRPKTVTTSIAGATT